MAILFPPGLPPLKVVNGVSGTAANNVIRTAMDTGPAKVRRRSTAAPSTRRLSHPKYTLAQLRTFLAFYRDTEALPFEMYDPISGEVQMHRFTAPPTYASVDVPDRFSIQVEMEILP